MSALVESLPTVENGDLRVWSAYNEGNVITASQVAIATAKGWKVLDANNDLYAGVPVEKGDANGDGELTIDDAVAVANSIIGQTSVNIDAADVNNDGEVTIADATIIINNVIIADAKAELMTQIKTSKEMLDACMAKLREMGSAPDHSDLWSLANEIAADIEAVKTKAANATTQDDIDDCNDDVNAIATKLATLNERINQLMYG
jgi:ubiquinone biosynthesis protein UbiJ